MELGEGAERRSWELGARSWGKELGEGSWELGEGAGRGSWDLRAGNWELGAGSLERELGAGSLERELGDKAWS